MEAASKSTADDLDYRTLDDPTLHMVEGGIFTVVLPKPRHPIKYLLFRCRPDHEFAELRKLGPSGKPRDWLPISAETSAVLQRGGWKVHLSVQGDQLEKAWNLVYPFLLKGEVTGFKVARPFTIAAHDPDLVTSLAEEKRSPEQLNACERFLRIRDGAQITIYLSEEEEEEGRAKKAGSRLSLLLAEVEKVLATSGIRPGQQPPSDVRIGRYASTRRENWSRSQPPPSGFEADLPVRPPLRHPDPGRRGDARPPSPRAARFRRDRRQHAGGRAAQRGGRAQPHGPGRAREEPAAARLPRGRLPQALGRPAAGPGPAAGLRGERRPARAPLALDLGAAAADRQVQEGPSSVACGAARRPCEHARPRATCRAVSADESGREGPRAPGAAGEGPGERQVPADAPAERLDKVVARLFGVSRGRAMEWIAEGRVRVDGLRAPKGTPVGGGARVLIDLPPPDAPVAQPELPLRIVHADAQVVVADKPAGMPSHPLKPGETGTAANGLVGRFPELASVGPAQREGGLVHRLDTDTSGLLLAARTDAAHQLLRAQFSARTVDKGYLALAQGEIHAGGEIDLPLAHDPGDSRRVRAASDPDWAALHNARPALTRFTPLERRGGLTLLEVEIATGVLHQIRAHLAFIGHPLAGDPLYGGPPLPGLARHFLHAARLGFTHPDGSRVRYESPLPAELERIFQAL
jgi:23S rRNA pseudouridine1911/1915/1917 synthase